MAAPLESAIRFYKAGDFAGLIRDHGFRAANPAAAGQMMLVLLGQSHIKLGNHKAAAPLFGGAGTLPGPDSVQYLLLGANLHMRHSEVESAWKLAMLARERAPGNAAVDEVYFRVLQESCLFEEIERETASLLRKLKSREPGARQRDNPFNNINWCDDEAVNGSLMPAYVGRPVTPAMQAARRARPHHWGEKLRIGYLSDDYYDQHPVMRLFQGVMASHDPARVEVTHFCFTSAANIASDCGTRRHYPNLVQIGHLDDDAAANLIRARSIDILVDLKGHTQGCRPNLINLGLAPIQTAWLGYPGSGNGIDCDYVISDRIVTPDSSIPHYHEKLCRLPESYQPNDNLFRPVPQMASRQSLGLPEDKVIYGFFNATRKITPRTFRLTMEILKRHENSVLWILFFNHFAEMNFIKAAAALGIARDRIIVAPKAPYPAHLSRMGAADLCLDSFPYNGHTTTSDALWAGLPVVTARGRHFASRVSESLLTAAGLPDLVARNDEDYVELAVALGQDAERLGLVRDRLAQARADSPLFDTQRFARHLEDAFEAMAQRARQGLAPDHIDIIARTFIR